MIIERFDPTDHVRAMGLNIDIPAVGYVGTEDGEAVGCGGLAWGRGKCWMWFHVEQPQTRHARAVIRMANKMKALAMQMGDHEVYTVRDTAWPSSAKLLRVLGFEFVSEHNGCEIHRVNLSVSDRDPA